MEGVEPLPLAVVRRTGGASLKIHPFSEVVTLWRLSQNLLLFGQKSLFQIS
jgi:hypothetical protein